MKSAWITIAWAMGCSHAAAAECRVETERALPLLELYTSEGCSSCPPADRWLARKVAGGGPLDWVPLAFHVDYWDYIGWVDRFAVPAHARRQRERVHAAGQRVVYTPQVMLGPEVRLDWRDESAMAVAAARVPPSVRLSLHARALGTGHSVELAARSLGAPALQLELVVYGDGLVSRVDAGENRSVVLHHDRVVRRVFGPWPLAFDTITLRHATIAAPHEQGERVGVVAIISEPGTAKGGWALDLPLSDCVATGTQATSTP